jgi:sigma-B regulation protein RsbU (phosphoserine phosphatase)
MPMPSDDRSASDLEALFEQAACGLLRTDTDGTIREVNATFCSWIGRSASELAGRRKVQDLLTVGGRIFHQTHWAPLLQIQGSVAEVKLEVVHRDGRTLPMVMNAVRIERDGVACHHLAVFSAQDRHQYEKELLLARRRAEELLHTQQQAQRALSVAQAKLRLALESARLYVWDVDPASGLRRYEDEVARLLGDERPRPVSDAEFVARIHPDDRAAEAQAWAVARDAAGGAYDVSYRLSGAGDQWRTVRATGQGRFDADGRLVEFVGMLHDVTELARQRAVAEDRAVFAEQMIGIVSHDLRNPLSAIQMSAHLLARSGPTAKQLPVLGRITHSASRADRLIADLLDFTQARLGDGLKVAPRPLDLHGLVADSIDELALAFPGRVLTHRRAGEGSCRADADRLVQLIGNLVANAMVHGDVDAPVTVTSSVHAERFVVDVHNEGQPIPPDLLPRLFEPMARGRDVATAGRSVGLGLFIVREIVKAHGGSVGVQSAPGSGTRFTAEFPR